MVQLIYIVVKVGRSKVQEYSSLHRFERRLHFLLGYDSSGVRSTLCVGENTVCGEGVPYE